MASGGSVPVREFTSVAEMQRHAAEVRARLFSVSPAAIKAPLPRVAQEVQPAVQALKTIWHPPIVMEHSPVTTAAQLDADVLSVADAIRLVAAVSGHTKAQLVSSRRTPELSRARHIVCWLGIQHCCLTLNQVGAQIGRRDHTSVLYGDRRVAGVIKALGLDMSGDFQRKVTVLWNAQWPKVLIGRSRRPCV